VIELIDVNEGANKRGTGPSSKYFAPPGEIVAAQAVRPVMFAHKVASRNPLVGGGSWEVNHSRFRGTLSCLSKMCAGNSARSAANIADPELSSLLGFV
jgi:hypothetical protein